MEQKMFSPEELVLVDTHALINHERWEPGVYVEALPNGMHLVEVMKNGRKATLAYPDFCVRHASEAYDLEVRFEVYVDSFNGSDVVTYEGVDGEKKAIKGAEDWTNQANAPKYDVVIDRVVIGGVHPFKKIPPKK